MSTIRVLCADDNPAFNRLHASLLDAEPDLTIVGMVSDSSELLPSIQRLTPDVVLLDLSLASSTPQALVEDIVHRCPRVHVVVLSGLDQPTVVEALFAAGASGFIAKGVPPEHIGSAIRSATRGELPRIVS